MGILNVQKLTSSVNIHEWTHGYFEYSKADVWTFWIFMRWHHWYFEYEVTLWNYSEADAMGILNIVIFNIENYVVFWIFIVMTSLQEYSKYKCHYEYSHDGTLWVFKIPMTSLHGYSKYPWRQLEYSLNYRWPHLMNTEITHFMSIQKTNYITPMNFQNTHEAFWIFMKWRHGNILEVMSWVFWIFKRSVILNTWHRYFELFWMFMTWVFLIFKRSRVIL